MSLLKIFCRPQWVLVRAIWLLWFFCSAGAPAMAATITVNSPLQVANPGPDGNSDGLCQLSEAIRAANTDLAVDGCAAGSGADTIVVPAGTYTITLPDNLLNDGYNGLPRIESAMTIQGVDAASTIIERATGTSPFRIFEVTSAGDLTLKAVTVRNGADDWGHGGGAVLNAGLLTINDAVFEGNTAYTLGVGGGAVAGGATISNSVFAGNAAGGQADGGALLCTAECSVTDSTFVNNVGESGGAIAGGAVTIAHSDFVGNSAIWSGGAVSLSSGSIRDSLFENNDATTYGAAVDGSDLVVSGSTFQGNWLDPNYGYDGGAILARAGSVTISNSAFVGNSGIDDGSVGCVDAIVSFNNVTFLSNSSWPGWGTLGCGTLNNSISDDFVDPLFVPGEPGPMVGANVAGYTRGAIPTWRPSLSSPALDSGDAGVPGNGGAACEATDQRGIPRPIDGNGDGAAVCDLGAYEAPTLQGYPVSVTLAGTGTGSVTSLPASISCSPVCSAAFESGAVVTLTASAASGSVFAGWSGSCDGTGTCTVTIDAAKSMTAIFNNTPPDTSTPIVAITAPANAATVSGSAVTIAATATDNVGVAGVQFKLDGVNLGAEDTTVPYSLVWDTTQATNGTHTLVADARDAAGNHGTAAVTVTVSNTPPTDTTAPTVAISTPGNGSTVSGSAVAIAATATDNVGVAGVQFKVDGANLSAEDTTAPYSLVWDTTQVTNGAHTLIADAHDAAGNHGTATVMLTVSNTPPTDTTAPTVAISTPGNGSTVSGSAVAIAATATDNVGVAGVQFKLDGANLGAEDTTVPYAVAWDTTTTTNGSHTLTVSARDAAGNLGVAVAISVTVNNSTDFGLTAAPGAPTSVTVGAGGTANFYLNVEPTTGFTGSLSFSCSGAPAASTCAIAPNPANVSGTAATAIVVRVATMTRSGTNGVVVGRTGKSPAPPHNGIAWTALLACALLVMPVRECRRRKRLGIAWGGLVCAVLALLLACGGTGSGRPLQPPPSTGTPAGTYTVRVAGTSGEVTHAFDLKLTVN